MKPLEIVIVGAGDRADCYSELALRKPDKLRIVGLVDPDPARLAFMSKKYNVPKENHFTSLEDFLAREKFADAVLNGTLDHLHVATSVPVLEKGYDLLLEKPFCVNEEEMWTLLEAARRTGRKVMICHVLRYTPFYRSIKEHIMAGEIGKVLSISLTEHAAYHHYAAAFVRGKWANESVTGAPLLLAKSCHDLDLMMWFMDDVKPVQVSSFGSDLQFRPENKPTGAGHTCMVDCPACIESECMYSARKNYLEPEMHWMHYAFQHLQGRDTPREEAHKSLLDPNNKFARCVWDCEHDLVDHQTVIVNFEDGVTGTFVLIGGSAKAERNIHIVGTKGEIKGVFQDSKYVIRKAAPNDTFEETLYDVGIRGSMDGEGGGHGGGDLRMAADFVEYAQGGAPSISCTSLEDSMRSHLAVFRAEKARKNGTVEKIL